MTLETVAPIELAPVAAEAEPTLEIVELEAATAGIEAAGPAPILVLAADMIATPTTDVDFDDLAVNLASAAEQAASIMAADWMQAMLKLAAAELNPAVTMTTETADAVRAIAA